MDEFSTEVPGDEECGCGEGEGKDIEDVGEPVPDGGVEPEQQVGGKQTGSKNEAPLSMGVNFFSVTALGLIDEAEGNGECRGKQQYGMHPG